MELKPYYETKLGKLYCGDAIDLFEIIPDKSIDMVLTDLPYGVTECKWDEIIPLKPLWEQYNRIIKDDGVVVLTASQPFTSVLVMSNVKMFKHEWIWIKNRGSNFANTVREPMKEHESVLVFSNNGKWTYNKQMQERTGTGGDRVKYGVKFETSSENYREFTTQPHKILPELRVPSSWQKFNTEVGLHPTQKPIALFEYLIKTYTNEGDMVHDSCMGSGTSAVACENFQRRWIGFEISKEYCEHAKKRISKYQTTESTSILNTEIL